MFIKYRKKKKTLQNQELNVRDDLRKSGNKLLREEKIDHLERRPRVI